jgi:hypothetical protein
VPGEDLPTAPASQVGSAVTSPASASNKSISEQQQKKINIGRKSTSWYSLFLNRWVSFFGVKLIFKFSRLLFLVLTISFGFWGSQFLFKIAMMIK